MMTGKSYLKYIYAFFLTFFILWVGVFLVNSITERKIQKIQDIESGIAINILSLETQFALLQEFSCENVQEGFLTDELGNLARKLQFMEENSPNDPALLRLKKYYFLLEIKDLILSKKVSEQCGKDLHYILYFYSNKGECKDCSKQGIALTKLLKSRDDLKVYSFDYNIKLSALDSLKKIYKVSKPLPALVIDGKTFNGYLSVEKLESILPELANEKSDDKTNTLNNFDKR